tara:strand:+ start:12674 stop:12931 length:258 start_codon:yes stop_codon:yes gene_type:complete
MKYVKQMIADFLRKLIKLDDYIADRVFTEVERLEAEIKVVNDLANSNESELNDKPTFYDMESHVEHTVNDGLTDVIERLKKLEDK